MRSRRWEWTHTYAVPMFVSSLVAVVLTGSALAAVLMFGGGEPADPVDPAADPTEGIDATAPATAGPDATGIRADGPPAECLLGSWTMTSETRTIDEASQELVEGGPVAEFGEDGTGSIDYGERSVFEGRAYLVLSYTAEASGDLEFAYELTEDGLLIEVTANNTDLAVETGLPESGERPEAVGIPAGPYTVECDADTLTLRSETEEIDYTAEYERA